MAAPSYYKSLDGFRALAVSMVLMIHARWMPIGWVGVQMFFVLSGFLITGILVNQKNARFSDYIGQFYWKRSLRIWPLYFLFCGLSAMAYFLFHVPETFKTSWLALISYTYNFATISPHFKDSWYFGHFWTLCIEEQFYLVWPFVVYFLTIQKLRRLVILLIIIGPAIRYLTGVIFGSVFDTSSVYLAVHHMTTSHIDAFACGALLVLIPADWRTQLAPRSRQLFFSIGAATILCGLANSYCLTVRGLPPHWLALGYGDMRFLHQYVWGYTLLNLTSAGLILCLIENCLLPSVFQHPAAVYLGTISYGIYVWHLPLVQILFDLWPADYHSLSGFARFLALFALTLLLASVSYFYFERFFLRMKQVKFSYAMSAISKHISLSK